MLAKKRSVVLSLFEQQKDGSTTASARNRHNYSSFSYTTDSDNYEIPSNYEAYSEITSGLRSGSTNTNDSSSSNSSSYSSEELTSILEMINNHINDRYVHITSEERVKWSSDPSVELEKLLDSKKEFNEIGRAHV